MPSAKPTIHTILAQFREDSGNKQFTLRRNN